MLNDPLESPPLTSADLPGIGGRIKAEPEDFEVEEIPAYECSGAGEFLFLWIEKRGIGAEYFMREVSRRLGIRQGDVGTAGLKDRHAVTRQWVSVPSLVEDRLGALDGDGIRMLKVERHGNKLRPGHLRGNRFRILVRDPVANSSGIADAIIERIRHEGLANFYGLQRFGKGGETVQMGWSLLRGEANIRNPFRRKLALSAVQSALFNRYLSRRLADGLMRTVLDGDVMAKWPAGGMFVTSDRPTEQARFDRREIVHAGPIFGRKTFAAAGEAARREAEILSECGIETAVFRSFGKLVQGTRRHNVVYVDDLAVTEEPAGLRFSFTLPAGSYATVLLQELMKSPSTDDGS